MDYILVDGKKYALVPVEEEEEVEEKVLEDYKTLKKPLESNSGTGESAVISTNSENGKIDKAVPKKYDYRERFKSGSLRPTDVMTFPTKRPRFKQYDPSSLDGTIARYAGYNPWIGEGTQVDF